MSFCRCSNWKPKPWHLVCPDCWRALPWSLRSEVWAAYQEKAQSPRHLAACRACYEWLDAHGHPAKPISQEPAKRAENGSQLPLPAPVKTKGKTS